MSKCKAKDPYRCPYHSRERLRDFKENIAYWELQLPVATSFEAYEDVVKQIATYKARVDANEKGFKDLTRELRKAQKAGDNILAAEIAHRLQNAADARLKDGVEGEWDASYRNMYDFGSKVLKLAETTDDVRIPISLSGTQNIMALYRRALHEGYTVVAADSHDSRFEDFTKDQQEEFFEELKTREQDVYNGNFERVWNDLFDKQGRYIRGITFVKDGRTITVRARSSKEEWADRFDV